MSTESAPAAQIAPAMEAPRPGKEILSAAAANELVFAVVGHVGSGTSKIAEMLEGILREHDVHIIKARSVIEAWAKANGHHVPDPQKTIAVASVLQDLGDRMRKETKDNAAVARAAVSQIRKVRAAQTSTTVQKGKEVNPDGSKRAYIIDALRHPDEALLLRGLYDTAFTLIGVVCDEENRLKRIGGKFSDGGQGNAKPFMERDAKAQEKNGQRVSDTFHLSDFFVDNSEDDKLEDEKPNLDWAVPDELERLVKLVTHKDIVRPTHEETAMFAAHGAQLRSACLSRQVGAALLDVDGNLVSTGNNEVPKAGGGSYNDDGEIDERCAYRSKHETRECSNTIEQQRIIHEIAVAVGDVLGLKPEVRATVEERIGNSRVSGLLEFSRAVHAEMDALLASARRGISMTGGRMFVTTYPCHYCARHLVAAGVDEVQFIEPYPKSKALDLHADAITHRRAKWTPPSLGGPKVLFRAFTGVAPRMYDRAFQKDRELKDSKGKKAFGSPDGSNRWNVGCRSYTQLEADLEL